MLVFGENEAENRLKAQLRQGNSGGIEYPSGTNMRGYEGGRGEQYVEKGHRNRERHADGDVIGGQQDQSMSNQNMMQNPQQQNYRRGGRACHAEGDMADREHHSFGSFLGDLGSGFKKGAGATMGSLSQVLPMFLNEGGSVKKRGGRMNNREHHSFGGVVGNILSGGGGLLNGFGLFADGGNVGEGGSHMDPSFNNSPSGARRGSARMKAIRQANAYAEGGDVNDHEEFNRRSRPPMFRN